MLPLYSEDRVLRETINYQGKVNPKGEIEIFGDKPARSTPDEIEIAADSVHNIDGKVHIKCKKKVFKVALTDSGTLVEATPERPPIKHWKCLNAMVEWLADVKLSVGDSRVEQFMINNRQTKRNTATESNEN